MAAGELTIQVKADTKSFDKQIYKLEKDLEELENQKYKIDLGKDDGDIDDIEAKIEKIKNKLIGLRQEKEKLNKTGFQQSNADLSGIGDKVEGIIKKVGRWALAVFSVRSAYFFIRQMSGVLAQYNEQYGADLEYIRFALAQALAPVLEYIVNLARTLLAYINYIAGAWFGVNLFANASADAFKKAKNNIGGAAKSAKELQKTLTGFDEMNILNSTSTGGGGGAGGVLPNFDLSDLSDIAIPDWLKWIGENKDKIISAIQAIAVAFLIFKTLQITGILAGIGNVIKTLFTNLGLLRGTFATLGIAAIIIGISTAIKGLIDFIKDPSWDNFATILGGIAIACVGLTVVMVALGVAINATFIIIVAIIAIVALLANAISSLINKESEEEKAEKALAASQDKLRESRERLTTATNNYINAVDNAEEAERKLQEAQDETGISIDDLLKLMQDENLTYKDLNEQQRKVYKAYMENKDAQEDARQKTLEFNKAKEEEARGIMSNIADLYASSKSYDEYRDKVVKAYKEGKYNAEEASIAIMYAMRDMDEETKKVFTKNLPNDIKNGLNPDNYQSWANNMAYWWNNQFMTKLNTNIKINPSVMPVKGYSTGGYVTKLATGGLINLPGRGVPVSNAIAGEAGTEGIIPLTDNQAMQKLGEAIGRYITINANITNTMNGRVISRELNQIRQDRDFAYNT